MGLAMLPIGIALAVLVILRTLLLIAGWEAVDPLSVIWILIQGPVAAFLIWSGREFRRTANSN
jgi:hypothetical protein